MDDHQGSLAWFQGRRQIFRQFLASEALRQFLPAVHNARHGNGIDALLRHIAQSLFAQIFRSQPLGRPAAGIQPIKLAGFGVIYNHEQIAADAIHHRRHDPHHGVRGNRGIDRISAMLQDLHAGLRRQRRLRRHNSVARNHHRARLPPVLRKRSMLQEENCRQNENQNVTPEPNLQTFRTSHLFARQGMYPAL